MMLAWVAAGGAIGAMCRYLMMSAFTSTTFPYATLSVNTLGGFVMGVLVVLFTRILPVPLVIQSFLTVGILGGFTTFSTFSLDMMRLLERGEIFAALLYALASVIGSVAALWGGMVLTRWLVHG